MRPQRILVVGGDARSAAILHVAGVEVETVQGTNYGGSKSYHRITAVIRHGAPDLVVVLVRWLGHSESARLSKLCSTAKVPCLLVPGGLSSAKRQIADFICEAA